MSGLQFLAALLAISLSLSLVMAIAWLVWRRTGNSGWVDMVWTFGLGTVAVAGALAAPTGAAGFTTSQALVAGLLVAWSLRLGLHIAKRTAAILDDPRYAKLLRNWGDDASRQMFLLLQKQALVSIPLAVAAVLAAWNPYPTLRLQDFLGIGILLVAILGEMIADNQLRHFRSEPANKGRICDTGLWAWSRHPNYFFQWLGWLAYPLLAIDLSGSYPWGWLALIGPACMYWLLVHVSGIPPLEEHMLERRGDAFRAYQARTNAFFPAPPRAG